MKHFQSLRRSGLFVAAASAIVASAGTARAQDERALERILRTVDESFRIKVDERLGVMERSTIDAGGYVSFSALWLKDSTGNNRRLLSPEIGVWGRGSIDGVHNFFVRGRFQYRDFSEDDSFDGRGDRWTQPFLDRYWYEFSLASAYAAYRGETLNGDFRLKVGRQYVDWGSGLVLSNNLYAARPTIRIGRVQIEGLFGVTPADRSIIDFDASRDGYNNNTKRGYYGGLFRYRFPANHELYAYGLYMDDYNDGRTPRTALVAPPVDFRYRTTYAGVGAQGQFTTRFGYMGEFVYQFGRSFSDPLRGAQTREDVSAFAGRAQLVYNFNDARSSQLYFDTIIASGDRDRLVSTDTVGGNLSGTTDRAFNSLGYVNTGLAFAPQISNLLSFRLGGSFFPFAGIEWARGLQLGADLFIHNKLLKDAPIEEATTNNMFLGVEPVASVNWRLTSDLVVAARYGVFFPGSGIAGPKDVRQFIFCGVTLSF
ncbi:MAG: alginate export family protein [Phycisphaerales bacterium]|nr:alginate export family protein [Phycisphaerales bacterium]